MKRVFVLGAAFAGAAAVVSGLGGCMAGMPGMAKSSPAIFVDPGFTTPMKVAVLPFDNESVDLDVHDLYRNLFAEALKEKKYEVLPLQETDTKLREMGVTQGGQLKALKNVDIQKKLGVEGLVFGNMKEAKYLTVGVKKEKKVTGHASLFKGATRLWEDEKSDGKSEYSLNPAEALKKQVVTKMTEKAMSRFQGHPLYVHVEMVVYKLQETLPGLREEKTGW